MVAPESVTTSAVPAPPMDHESQFWVDGLTSIGTERDAAVVRLHGLLLRVTTAEAHRRSARFRLFGPEVDDLAYQAAADASCRRIPRRRTAFGKCAGAHHHSGRGSGQRAAGSCPIPEHRPARCGV